MALITGTMTLIWVDRVSGLILMLINWLLPLNDNYMLCLSVLKLCFSWTLSKSQLLIGLSLFTGTLFDKNLMSIFAWTTFACCIDIIVFSSFPKPSG